jgi:hypothetical protein
MASLGEWFYGSRTCSEGQSLENSPDRLRSTLSPLESALFPSWISKKGSELSALGRSASKQAYLNGRTKPPIKFLILSVDRITSIGSSSQRILWFPVKVIQQPIQYLFDDTIFAKDFCGATCYSIDHLFVWMQVAGNACKVSIQKDFKFEIGSSI